MTYEQLRFWNSISETSNGFLYRRIKFFAKLPRIDEARVPGKQFMRAATSVGANYRAACRSKSQADFIHKLGTVVEEADECSFWLEVMEQSGVAPSATISPLRKEAEELLRICSTSLATAKRNAFRTR